MVVCAVICEYNPFHNGHAHQLRVAREKTNADYMVCLMSGAFTQRGSPAIVDKWTRARCALLEGADLVLEMPTLFALRPARDFAFGGVALAHALSVVTHLSFGAEDEDLGMLRSYVHAENDAHTEKMRHYLKQGLSYPAALSQATGIVMPPNVTLGVEYLRALDALHSPIEPVTVLREHSHHDQALHAMTSASAIRAALPSGKPEDVRHAMPASCFAPLADALHAQGGSPALDDASGILLNMLRTTSANDLHDQYGLIEGLEHRIKRAADFCGTTEQLLMQVKCKRYPLARLRRAASQMLLCMSARMMRDHPMPEYARVLGFRQSAAPLLRAIAKQSALPLITKVADADKGDMLLLDLRAQDMWSLLLPNPDMRKAHRDLTTSPVRL